MKILLVEDEEEVAEALAEDLSEQRFIVEIASDGWQGWQLIQAFEYDLILLDVMLPKLDGIRLCQQLRAHGYHTPVLMLTARDSLTDKVLGLDAGADDYIVKPFELQELAARVRALLRRGGSPLPPILQWGELHLDPSRCSVTYAGHPLQLTVKEYHLLELFLRHSRQVLSRNAILDHLWSSEDPPEAEAVKSHIKRLRQKLSLAGSPADLIETVYGLGYRLKPLS
ncbi:MAG: response regulator transcription factor [Cyanobacteriota bacterium]|nr:response regulator transcription factor [Cyanobacteriota bacterium]